MDVVDGRSPVGSKGSRGCGWRERASGSVRSMSWIIIASVSNASAVLCIPKLETRTEEGKEEVDVVMGEVNYCIDGTKEAKNSRRAQTSDRRDQNDRSDIQGDPASVLAIRMSLKEL